MKFAYIIISRAVFGSQSSFAPIVLDCEACADYMVARYQQERVPVTLIKAQSGAHLRDVVLDRALDESQSRKHICAGIPVTVKG